ncbi:hypothetical protein M3650_15240 [Paenibacillus sp. MER TA 81-3]|uniref:hypothetical protein n=1 Tax=Paenibacillus sp. MER TA 81-3 TaxID=2939573 RepID=UPI00203C4051|nr:hypothetical protein [Paenibacillus sp. MER TA 81-3]MCM3339949.1 hypothetical protein [Paenibacillus sp. MER TA 81-3]
MNQTYEAKSSHQASQDRRRESKPRGKFSSQLAEELQTELKQTWSPEQIAEKRREDKRAFVCFKTIYRWIYSGWLVAGDLQVLRHKGKRHKPVETR